jgi:hypothetical protein
LLLLGRAENQPTARLAYLLEPFALEPFEACPVNAHHRTILLRSRRDGVHLHRTRKRVPFESFLIARE